MLAGLVAGLVGRFQDEVDCRGVVGQIGRETAFVAHGRVELAALEHALEVMKHFAAAAKCVAELFKAQRHDHEFLHVDGVIGVLAAVDDVHHRRGQQAGIRAADVAVQRHLAVPCGRMGRGERDAEDRVRAEILLVRRAVQLQHPLVDRDLVHRIQAHELVGNLVVDIGDGGLHALAKKVRFVAVAELPRLVGAGAGTAGHGGGADRVVVQRDIDLDGGIAATIQNLPGVDINDHAHGVAAFRY